jgi:hypothetical protein
MLPENPPREAENCGTGMAKITAGRTVESRKAILIFKAMADDLRFGAERV